MGRQSSPATSALRLDRLRNERALRSQKGSRPRVSGSNRRPESAGLEFVQRKPLPTFRVEKITHSIWKNRTELARIGDRGGGSIWCSGDAEQLCKQFAF